MKKLLVFLAFVSCLMAVFAGTFIVNGIGFSTRENAFSFLANLNNRIYGGTEIYTGCIHFGTASNSYIVEITPELDVVLVASETALKNNYEIQTPF